MERSDVFLPNDLWSYRWVILRSLLILPLILLASVSSRFNNRYGNKIDRFITWDF